MSVVLFKLKMIQENQVRALMSIFFLCETLYYWVWKEFGKDQFQEVTYVYRIVLPYLAS